jgi:biotin carboxyl carrier protein
MKKYNIKLNNKEYEVEIETVSTEEITTISTESSKLDKSNNIEKNSGAVAVEAPMPGSILGVCVKVGDEVKKDQVVVILEAMKMENEIVSPVDGEIISIEVSKGDSVNVGQVLLQIG